MDRDLFIQGSTRTRVLEKRLLQNSQYERLIEAKDLDEALRFLNETDYAKEVNKLERPEYYELVLTATLLDLYKTMYEISPSPEIVDLISLKYVYHNLKVLMKEQILSTDFERLYVPIGKLDMRLLNEEIKSGNPRLIEDRYFAIIDEVNKQYEETRDPQVIDLIIDKHYFQEMLETANKTKVPLMIQYVEDLIDFTNIKTTIRSKKQGKELAFLNSVLIVGGKVPLDLLKSGYFDGIENTIGKNKTLRINKFLAKGLDEYLERGQMSVFEKAMDDYLMDLVKEAKKSSYGPEVLFAYLHAKETEIKNLRIILVSKVNGLRPEFIRERLRDAYV